jgi:endo-1,4-beta-xylanase
MSFQLKLCVEAEEKFMKKVLVVLAIVAMCGSIAQAGTGTCTSGSINGSFSNANFIAGLGWSTGTTRTISWSGSASGVNYGPAIYGWANSPLVEYYIGRSGGTSRGSYSTSKGSFTLYTNSCNGPNITGNGPFTQYNAGGNGSSSQNMGEHFNGWSNLGRGLSSQNCQVVMVESWSSGSGSYNISVSSSNWYTLWIGSGNASLNCGGGSSTSTTTSATSTSTTTTSTYSTSTTSSGGGTIVVRARGTSGQEQIQLNANSATVATWTLSTSMQNYSASTSATACAVIFTNDTSGRDVQVDYVVVQGSTRQAESQTTNTGVWQNNKCGGSYSEWLHCNGYIGF